MSKVIIVKKKKKISERNRHSFSLEYSIIHNVFSYVLLSLSHIQGKAKNLYTHEM